MILTIIILSIILLLAIAVIIMLLFIANDVAKDEMATKIELYNLVSKTAPKNSIVFLGDSITEFFRVSEIYPNKSLHNRGIATDTTDGILNRLEGNLIAMQPKKVFLMAGTNDLDKKLSPQAIVDNIIQIVNKLRNEINDVKIIIWSLCPVNKNAKLPISKVMVGRRTNDNIDKINTLLKAFADSNNINFIDTSIILKDNKGELKKEYTYEGLHLTYPAYLAISNLFTPYLD